MFRFVTVLIVVLNLTFVYNQTNYVCLPNAACGCSARSATLSRIVGGELASSLTWGWAASLRFSSTGSHFCGGAIITESHILTAAHCTAILNSPSSVRVVVGTIYLDGSGQERGVSRIYNHPSYDSNSFLNDIAILKLSTPLNLNDIGLDRICLPNVTSTAEFPRPNSSLVAIGWGVTTEGSSAVSPVLRQVTIRSVSSSSSYCTNLASDTNRQLCAGNMPTGGKDTCQGDSGGPLMFFNERNLWEIVGVTSNGYGCARPNLPGLYTKVNFYQSWINATINHAQPTFIYSSTIFIPIFILFAW